MKGEVLGIEQANDDLQAELRRMGSLSERFVTQALISVSAQTLPMVPIATSFLVNSEYRKVEKGRRGYAGEIGYGAEYAIYVHEAEGSLKGQPRPKRNGVDQGNYWDPDGEPGFLAKGVEAFIEDELDGLIRKELGR